MLDSLQNNQRGSVLLMAMMILAVTSTIAFTLSSLVYREVALARVYDDSIQSYSAASTGIERGLDILNEHRKVDDSLDSSIATIKAYATPALPLTLTSSDAQMWFDAGLTGDTATTLRLPVINEASTQIELYDPDNPFVLQGIESLQLYWQHPPCTVNSRIEVTYEEFDASSFEIKANSIQKDVYTCGSEAAPAGWDCQATSNWPSASTNYIIRVKALDCPIYGADLTIWDSDDGANAGCPLACNVQLDIPSRPVITAVGQSDSSQRILTARTKWVPSASGLVDFVLFSVEPLAK